jgi:invasion protein IalB
MGAHAATVTGQMDPVRRTRFAMPAFIRAATVAVAAAWLALVAAPAAFAQDNAPPAAWRVECGSDGKKLDCRAVQQVFNRADNKLLAF